MTSEGYYVGEGLKFRFDINATGFDQSVHPYTIDIYCGEKHIRLNQYNVKEGDDGHFYLPVKTDSLEPGPMKMVVTALVPDDDFEEGYRKQIVVKKLRYLKDV